MPVSHERKLVFVIYNLDLKDEVPIISAKIVVDTIAEDLKLYEPGLLLQSALDDNYRAKCLQSDARVCSGKSSK